MGHKQRPSVLLVVQVIQQKRNTSLQGQMCILIVAADFFFGGSYLKQQFKLSLQSVKYYEPHAGHNKQVLENLQRFNLEGGVQSSPAGQVDNEGNLKLVCLPGKTRTLTGRSVVTTRSHCNRGGAERGQGCCFSRGEEGSVVDIVQAHNTEWVSNQQEATLHP